LNSFSSKRNKIFRYEITSLSFPKETIFFAMRSHFHKVIRLAYEQLMQNTAILGCVQELRPDNAKL